MASDHLPNLVLPQLPIHGQFSIWHTFKQHILQCITTILVDVILPVVIYFPLQKHIRPIYALLIAGTPPLFMVISKALISRTFDALGFLVFLSFTISAIVALITRNPIILLLEKSLITGIASLIFAISLIPFHCCSFRPLAYYFYQDLVPTNREEVGLPDHLFTNEQRQQRQPSVNEQHSEQQVLLPRSTERQDIAQVYEWIYSHCSSFRHSCYMITGIWSLGLFSEFLARLTLILVHLSVNKLVIYGNVILICVAIICTLLSINCVIRERKQTMILIEQWKQEHLHVPQINDI